MDAQLLYFLDKLIVPNSNFKCLFLPEAIKTILQAHQTFPPQRHPLIPGQQINNLAFSILPKPLTVVLFSDLNDIPTDCSKATSGVRQDWGQRSSYFQITITFDLFWKVDCVGFVILLFWCPFFLVE